MVTIEEITAITDNVVATMLQSSVQPIEDSQLNAGKKPITGCVQITGQWNGAVLVQATGAFADRAAARMLAIDESQIGLEDRQDTIAELTNMIGGNIKSLVPGPSLLSLPSVTTGNDFDIRVFGATIENAVPFMCEGELVRIVVCRGATR